MSKYQDIIEYYHDNIMDNIDILAPFSFSFLSKKKKVVMEGLNWNF